MRPKKAGGGGGGLDLFDSGQVPTTALVDGAEEGGNMFLRNTGIYLQVRMTNNIAALRTSNLINKERNAMR
jgi:hypothetical protein